MTHQANLDDIHFSLDTSNAGDFKSRFIYIFSENNFAPRFIHLCLHFFAHLFIYLFIENLFYFQCVHFFEIIFLHVYLFIHLVICFAVTGQHQYLSHQSDFYGCRKKYHSKVSQ